VQQHRLLSKVQQQQQQQLAVLAAFTVVCSHFSAITHHTAALLVLRQYKLNVLLAGVSKVAQPCRLPGAAPSGRLAHECAAKPRVHWVSE
jgi:hypothetical protein